MQESEKLPLSVANARQDSSASLWSTDFEREEVSDAQGKLRLTMVTAVWGKWHLDMHFNVNLPTLLAPGNLPALAEQCEMTYYIFTRKADFRRVDTAPETEVLRQIMSVEIRWLDEADLKDPIATHHKAWNQAIREAAANGSLALLMPPDVAWADNSFASIVKRLKNGARAIFMTYLRAESSSFVEALLERKPDGEIVNRVPPQEMVELCVRSLHPLMAAYLRDSDYFPIHPEMILWAVPGEGFAVRVLAREMFIFDPRCVEFNAVSLLAQPLGEETMSFMADSDELFAVSLATLGKDVAWHVNAHKADPVEIAGWWLTYDSPVNDFMVSQKIRWHFAPVTEEKWRAKERGCDLFVRRVALTREGMRIWQAMCELECTNASLALSLAVHTGVFQRGARGRGGAIVLVPSDAAFAREENTYFERLLTPEGAQMLAKLIRAHHIPDAQDAVETRDPLAIMLQGEEQREVQSGQGPLMLRQLADDSYEIGGARVINGPLRIGRHTVYVLDRLFDNLE
jgi:hypothetical protein